MELRPVLTKIDEWHRFWRDGDVGTEQVDRRHWLEVGQLKVQPLNLEPDVLPMPFASDIASVSADLLFGDPATLTFDGEGMDKANEVLEEWIQEAMLESVLLESAEVAAADGGVYLRISDDPVLSPMPIVDAIWPDRAVPHFSHGRLRRVVLWKIVDESGGRILRLLEYHRPGVIEHGLYRGTAEKLGTRIPLSSHGMTAGLSEMVVLPFEGLAVEWVRNMGPEKSLPRGYGRSDLDGIEHVLSALNDTWASWMHDIYVGRGRVVVPRDWLRQITESTVGFKWSDDVFVGMDYMADEDSGPKVMEIIQFDIRVEAHLGTHLALMETAVSSAGYSPQSFGLEIKGRAESGTALNVRERKTFRTRQRKLRYWQRPVPSLAQKAMLMMSVTGERPSIEFPDVAAPGMSERSETISRLRGAMAMSVHAAVEEAHPDWTEVQVLEEAERILREHMLTDAAAVGVELFSDPDMMPSASSEGMEDD